MARVWGCVLQGFVAELAQLQTLERIVEESMADVCA